MEGVYILIGILIGFVLSWAHRLVRKQVTKERYPKTVMFSSGNTYQVSTVTSKGMLLGRSAYSSGVFFPWSELAKLTEEPVRSIAKRKCEELKIMEELGL